jgi:hypothetical protein
MTIRGMIASPSGTQMAMVVDDSLLFVRPDGVREVLGTLVTRRGPVGMKVGLNQLVVVDGGFGYVVDLETAEFTQITSDGWRGSYTVEYLDGYFVFIDPISQTFYTSALEDALTISALDTADASGSPDKLVGQVVTSRVLVLFGEISGEIWQNTAEPSPGVPFSRNSGAFLEVGLMAAHSVKTLDNSAYWLGRDYNGAGMVYRMEGFRPQRISTMAVEQSIQRVIMEGRDISQAVAYTYQQGGHSFYCLQVPGLDTTWCYDAATQQWHERAELVDGTYQQHRVRHTCYAYGKVLAGGDDDIVYYYDVDANTNAGDVLVRDRISPHYAVPSLDRVKFPAFELDCTVGYGKAGDSQARVMMRYSNDGGFSWSPWLTSTVGAVGQKTARARFLRCGSARDRVWQVRMTDDTPWAIVAAHIEAA